MLISWLLAGVQAPGVSATVPRPLHTAEEIIVTGERANRLLRDTPSSVVVATREDIEASGADQVEQLLAAVPNVQLGSGSQGPAIRGLDTTGPLQALPAFLGGNRPRTTVVIDGRPLTYNEFVFGSAALWDVKSVEVYRSPQTTTQGQNSIAGAIFVNSEDPHFSAEQRFRVAAGDYHMRQLSAAASIPASGDVALRVAGDMRYSRTSSDITDVMRGAEPNHQVHGLLRGKLLIAPRRLPDSRLLVTLTHAQSQAPQIVGVTAPFEERVDTAPNYGVFRVRSSSGTASLRHDFGNAKANLLFTIGRSSARRFAFPGFGETSNDAKDWSGELVVNWEGPGTVHGVAGLSHAHVSIDQGIDLSLLSGLVGTFSDRQDGTGIFGEASVEVAPRLTVTGGLRYQRDRQKRKGALVTNSFSVPADFVGRFSRLLPKLSLTYAVSPDWRAGLLVQKAYNPGGTTIRFDTTQPDVFEAESLWDTEVFVRGSAAAGKLQFRANLFRYAMRNAQRADPITILTPTGRRVGFANLFNVPRARSQGAEATIEWQDGRSLRAYASVGLLNTRILEPSADAPLYDGKAFDRSPRFTGALAVDWRPLRGLRLSAQVRRHSGYFSDNLNSPQLRVGAATIADAQARYDLRRFALFVQARNLFDEFAMLVLNSATSGQAEEPRRIIVGLEAGF